jgi:peptidylprolyl isomerase
MSMPFRHGPARHVGARPAAVRHGALRRGAAPMVALGAALLLAACAGDSGETSAPGEPASSPSASNPGTAPDAVAILDQVHPDRAEPPTTLGVVDLVVGSGAPAAPGDHVVVHYVGVRWSDGGTFDASWTRGQTFSFLLGGGQVIAGWDQGVEGMQVGGRRVLTIPPGLAYGDRGAGGVIGPGETLVFVVDLVETARP